MTLKEVRGYLQDARDIIGTAFNGLECKSSGLFDCRDCDVQHLCNGMLTVKVEITTLILEIGEKLAENTD